MPPERFPARAALEGREVAEGQEALHLLLAPPAGDLVEVGVEVQVLQHGQVRVEPEALAHVADAVLDAVRFRPDGEAVHPGLARCGGQDAREEAHGGRLPGAVRPHEAEDLAFRHGEREAVHGGQVAEAPREALGDDGVHQRAPASISASAGMPGLSSMPGFGTSILMRYTSFTRSFFVWTLLGVNSASEEMKETRPSYFFPG